MRKLGTELRESLEQATLLYQQSLDSLCGTRARDYLTERGLHPELVARRYRLGYVDEPAPGHEMMKGRLSIPYLTPAGPVDIKFRCIDDHDCKAEKCPKYLGIEGGGGWLYNARAVLAAKDCVVITEGEIDAMSVSAIAGIPAVGYPGTSTWQKSKHWPRVFAGLDVVVVADGDKPGRDAARLVAKSMEGARIAVMPEGEDSNSFLTQFGPDAFRERVGL